MRGITLKGVAQGATEERLLRNTEFMDQGAHKAAGLGKRGHGLER